MEDNYDDPSSLFTSIMREIYQLTLPPFVEIGILTEPFVLALCEYF